jgi:hypothetical protein
MKSWKLVFGMGGACAACCALPVLGGLAALGGGTSALLAGVGDKLAPAAWATAALAAVAGSIWLWRRRLSRTKSTCGCVGTDGGTPPRCGIEVGSCQ